MLFAFLLTAFLAAAPQNPLDSGRRALESGDLVRAEQDFRQYLSEHPESAEALSNLGAICARREQFREAVGFYETALKADPKLVPVHFNLAISLGRLNQYGPAVDHLRTFLKSYPQEPRARQLLGLCLTEIGDFRGALPELEASYKLNAKDASILYSLAYANARAGDVDRAADLLRQSEADPSQAGLIEGLIEYRRGRFPEAKALFQGVLTRKPDSFPALTALGRLELLDHNDAEAIRLLERALILNPSDAESTYQLGVLYDRNGRTAEGVKLLGRAITLRANYPDPHYHLGRIAVDRKDFKTALAELELARRLLPDQEAIRLLLGRTYQALGRTAEAQAEFAEVRRLKAAVIERDRQRVESDALMKPPDKPDAKPEDLIKR
jgi:Flp pilus assembly protein TadD